MSMRPVWMLVAIGTLAACAGDPKTSAAVAVVPPAPSAPVLDEDRLENPAPEWILADWANTDRTTRVRLLAYARDATRWTTQCKQGHAALAATAKRMSAELDAETSAIPATASPYDAFPAFRAARAHFVQSRDGIVKDQALGGWEAAFFFQPVEARLVDALLAWERARDPLLVSAVSTKIFGNGMPVATPPGSGVDDEARFCRHSRDLGTRVAAPFAIPIDLRKLVRPPFEGTDPAPTPAAPMPPNPMAYDVEGIVQSATTTSTGTVVRFVHEWTFIEQRAPCHPAKCTGIDCGMGGPRTVCTDVPVHSKLAFDATFATLPPGFAFRAGDAVWFHAAEEQTVVAPFHTHYRGIVIDWVDRKTERVFSLGP